MKKILLILLVMSIPCLSLFSQDTISLVYHNSGEMSLQMLNTGDEFVIIAYNQKGSQIFEQSYDLNTKLVDYTLTYFDSGAVESIKMTITSYEDESKEIQYVEFDKLGAEVKSKRVSGVDVVIEDEGKSFNFEGGIVFRPRTKDE